jgi:hypothetical protein
MATSTAQAAKVTKNGFAELLLPRVKAANGWFWFSLYRSQQ